MFAATLTWDWSLWLEIATSVLVALEISKHIP